MGFIAPKKPAAKKVTTDHRAQVKTRNPFSPLPVSRNEGPNEDIPFNMLAGEPYPALKACRQEDKGTGKDETASAAVLDPVPQTFVVFACGCTLQGSPHTSSKPKR